VRHNTPTQLCPSCRTTMEGLPSCRTTMEDQGHFLTCVTTTELWTSALLAIPESIPQHRDQGPLTQLFLWSITQRRDFNTPPQSFEYPPHYNQLIKNQTAIGWSQILKGRWTTDWVRQFNILNPSKGEQICTTLL
jgi:hypothetical protein